MVPNKAPLLRLLLSRQSRPKVGAILLAAAAAPQAAAAGDGAMPHPFFRPRKGGARPAPRKRARGALLTPVNPEKEALGRRRSKGAAARATLLTCEEKAASPPWLEDAS